MERESQEKTSEKERQKIETLDDSELEDVSGGTSPEQYDHYHQLPPGHGSGAGE